MIKKKLKLIALTLAFLSTGLKAEPPKVKQINPDELTQEKVQQIVTLRNTILPVLSSVPVWLETKYILTQASDCLAACQFSLYNDLVYEKSLLNLKSNYAVRKTLNGNVLDVLVENNALVMNYDSLQSTSNIPDTLFAQYSIKSLPDNTLLVDDTKYQKVKMDFKANTLDSYYFKNSQVNINASCSFEYPECYFTVNSIPVYMNMNTGYVVINNVDVLDSKTNPAILNLINQERIKKFLKKS